MSAPSVARCLFIALMLSGTSTRKGLYEKEFGPLRQRLDVGGWVILLIDSNPGDKTPVSNIDITWTREKLTTIPADTPIILCTHHPLMPQTKHYRITEADAVIGLFENHNLKGRRYGGTSSVSFPACAIRKLAGLESPAHKKGFTERQSAEDSRPTSTAYRLADWPAECPRVRRRAALSPDA